MLRRLLGALSLLSLIPCGVTVVLRVRGRFVADFVFWTSDGPAVRPSHYALLSGGGGITFLHTTKFRPYWLQPPLNSELGWRRVPEPITPGLFEMNSGTK